MQETVLLERRHRHAPDHSCSGLVDDVSAKEQKKAEIKAFVASKLWTSNTSAASSTSDSSSAVTASAKPKKRARKLNPAVELIKMKMHAKGENSVPMESRIYLRVCFPLESKEKTKSAPMFFNKVGMWTMSFIVDKGGRVENLISCLTSGVSKDWTIGRIIDKVATIAKVINVNNTGDEERKLHMFHYDTGERLDTSASLASLVGKKILQSGQTIILERTTQSSVDSTMYDF
ncbi:AN1-type zinc finger protein 1 [Quaeritorhiza haematococci]|nr:AN1-type zinc finger protein 1 [Quaeritorhiza haematococci]